MIAADIIVKEVAKGLLKWYDFKKNAKVLYIGSSKDSIYEALLEIGLQAMAVHMEESIQDEWINKYRNRFDYLIAVTVLEKTRTPKEMLAKWQIILKRDGILLLGMNNRLGLRYFCGDRDIYTDRVFDGIENYRRAYVKEADEFNGRMYAYAELRSMLEKAGWTKIKFYCVLPMLEDAQFIYAEDFPPVEDLTKRLYTMYHYPDTVFLEEIVLYKSIIENGMFSKMANAYLIECTINGSLSDITQVTNAVKRGWEHSMFTIIRGYRTVEKKAIYPQGIEHLYEIQQNHKQLKDRGIPVIEGEIKGNCYVMPFLSAPTAQDRLRFLFDTDQAQFLKELDEFRKIIIQSSEIEKVDEEDGIILKKGYPDMVLINSFYLDGNYIFYDQEFTMEHCPVNLLVYRIVSGLYHVDIGMHKILPIEQLFKRYGIDKTLKKWQQMETEFLDGIRNDRVLRIYHEKYGLDYSLVSSNRQRINYSIEEYQHLFIDIFPDTEGKEIILFGSGKFTKRFLDVFGEEYRIHSIVDNSANNWGKRIDRFVVQSPKILSSLKLTNYKIIICIKNYVSVMKQLNNMGITDYSIFDPNRDYPRKLKPIQEKENEKTGSKPYHVGYVAGVFDLFHIGHLNLLKNAKKLCDYLIVGVVPDEKVYYLKKKYPVIPCDERIEILKGCRYVDQAEVLPADYTGIRDAYKMFHFDCQFSGDDHNENPDWLADKEYLEKRGTRIIFLPYTEKTSSTVIRSKLINK